LQPPTSHPSRVPKVPRLPHFGGRPAQPENLATTLSAPPIECPIRHACRTSEADPRSQAGRRAPPPPSHPSALTRRAERGTSPPSLSPISVDPEGSAHPSGLPKVPRLPHLGRRTTRPETAETTLSAPPWSAQYAKPATLFEADPDSQRVRKPPTAPLSGVTKAPRLPHFSKPKHTSREC
jgi:hypothetical protein